MTRFSGTKNDAGSGFALLELLLAMTIFSVVVTSLYTSFYGGVTVLRRSRKAMEAHQNIRLFTEELSLDLRNALLAPVEAGAGYIPREYKQSGEEEPPVFYFTGEGRNFTFVSLKDRDLCRITYSFEKNEFVRTVKPQFRNFSEDPVIPKASLKDVENLEIQYSHEGEGEDAEPVWMNFWDQEEAVPLGVKISMKLKGQSSLRKLTKTILVPVGRLSSEKEEEKAK